MPIFLQHSLTLTPISTCFKAKVICSSVNFERRTGNLDSQAPSTLMNGPEKREEVSGFDPLPQHPPGARLPPDGLATLPCRRSHHPLTGDETPRQKSDHQGDKRHALLLRL